MTVYGEDIEKCIFVLEHVTSIERVHEDWTWVEKDDHWWSVGIKRVPDGFRFKVNMGADFIYIKGETEEKAVELRMQVIARLAEIKQATKDD